MTPVQTFGLISVINKRQKVKMKFDFEQMLTAVRGQQSAVRDWRNIFNDPVEKIVDEIDGFSYSKKGDN